MGYGFKYSTSTISNTLHKGKAVTTAGHSADPGQEFVAGIVPVEGKHTIVRIHQEDNPEYYSLTDDELVEYVTSLDQTIYGVTGAIDYIQGNDSLFYIDNSAYDNSVLEDIDLNVKAGYDSSFTNNNPTTNLQSSPSMIPSDATAFYTGGPTYANDVGSSGWSWSYYPNSNVSDDGGMIWNPNLEDPYGKKGVWIMKKRTGGNSESNWYGTAPGAIDETKDYCVSVWCKTDQASCFRIHLNVTQNGGSYWGYGSSQHNGDGTWQKLSVIIPKDSGNTSLNTVRCQANGTTIDADAQWKYYQVEQSSGPTDWVDGTRSQNTNWDDLSGNANNGTLTNGPLFDSPTKAISFDGTDDVIAFSSPSTLDYIYSDPFSLEVLINADVASGFNHLIGKSYADYRLAQNGSGISFRLDSNNITTQLGTITAGEWTHIVATWTPSDSTARVYQDGELKGSVTDATVDWTTTTGNFQIGNSPGESYFFDGKIALGRAYGKSLSLSEVQHNYFGGSIATDNLVLNLDAASLVSYQSGSTTANCMTGSIDGTLTNGVAFSYDNRGYWECDGTDDEIIIPGGAAASTINFGNTDNFSMETWVQIVTMPASGNTMGIFVKAYKIGIDLYFPTVNTMVFRCGVRNSEQSIISQTGGYTALGEWSHVVFTYEPESATGVKLYINGVLNNSGDNQGQDDFSNNTDYTIGGNEAVAGTPRFGNIRTSVARMYDRTLSALEVQQNYIALKSRFYS